MPAFRSALCLALAIGASAPAAAATAFWPFGFYFPNKAMHHAGGLSTADRPVKLADNALPDRPGRSAPWAFATRDPAATAIGQPDTRPDGDSAAR